MPIYRVDEKLGDAYGRTHKITGPGITTYCAEIHLLQPFNEWAAEHFDVNNDVNRLEVILHQVYEAGREAMRRELRETLGIR